MILGRNLAQISAFFIAKITSTMTRLVNYRRVMIRCLGIEKLKLDRGNSVLTIGNFDGVHLGHQAIVNAILKKAHEIGGPACLFTFRPHPQEVLRPGNRVKLLTTYDEKVEILESFGLDVVVEQLFSQEFFTLTAREFFERVVVKAFQAKALFVGHDFAFGRNRDGNIETLKNWCKEKGIHLEVIPPFVLNGETVSSTAIREKLSRGEVAEASSLLGRPFFYRGSVVRGDQRGRLLGFPTANLKLEQKLALPHGVYATWAIRKQGDRSIRIPSVTNVGIRPTFHPELSDLPVLIETHLILSESEFPDLYGETLEVQFAERFRDERKFSSFDELKTQIQQDRERAKAYFNFSK